MGAVIEVKYFNSFILKKTVKTVVTDPPTANLIPIWNGSFGIPEAIGGYPRPPASSVLSINWAIEEARIRGGYNNLSVDFGVKAFLVEDEPDAAIRGNSLIYSGIYNSRTGVNNTNVFSVGDNITKSADPINGSIQKLYAEDTNLIIFQEAKVSRALIDKDAIYTAEGSSSISNLNTTIGTIQAYAGEFGISKDPNSFAVYGYRKYFTDKDRNAVLRLSKDGLTEISSYGMYDYFRDEFREIDIVSNAGDILGAWDVYNKQYVLSPRTAFNSSTQNFNTLSFDENVRGWTSFFTYKPDQAFSLKGEFYSLSKSPAGLYNIWKHYSNDNRGTFYSVTSPSSISFVLNANPSISKVFQTVNYEGSNGWQVNSFISDETGQDVTSLTNLTFVTTSDTTSVVPSYLGGEYIATSGTALSVSASTNNTVVLKSARGVISIGANVYGIGVAVGTKVVSFNLTTKALVVSINLNIALDAALSFDAATKRADYSTVFGTTQPNFNRDYAGFNRKENKYYANLVNASSPTQAEVLWGTSISGIKGYFATVTMSTDSFTNPGGPKNLFSVASNFVRSS